MSIEYRLLMSEENEPADDEVPKVTTMAVAATNCSQKEDEPRRRTNNGY
jgi:hypothetical protein